MQMTQRQLRAFVSVARTLSFARACEQLHLSQPALSLAVRSLEQALGGRLFSRTTRQVRLTPEGADLLPLAEQLLADWERVGERLRARFALQTGHLAVAAMPTFAANLLPRLLRGYRERHPEVAISVRDVVHEQVLELVESGRVEVGFAFEPESAPALAFTPLLVDRFVAIVPRDSRLASERRIGCKGLMSEVFIALERPSSMRRLIEDALGASGLAFAPRLECSQLTTAIELVSAGLGVSVIPSLSRRQAEAAGARCLALSGPVIRKAVGLVHRRDQQLSAAALALALLARSVLRPSASGAEARAGAA